VTTADPLQAISAGTGLLEGRDGRRALDDRDRLDLVTMLTAYTAGSALVNGRPDRTGRIAPGFLADIAVLDQDIFDEPEALLSARAEEVWVDGRLAGARVGAALPVREEGVVAWG
jgi:predicted amidohydrolase YtcJ